MKYERLTKRDKDGKINVPLMNAYYIMQAYDRLADLEDKIESGDILTLDTLVKLFVEAFGDEPCNFGLFGVDINDYMYEHCGEWCEKECDNATPDKCWKKFLQARLKELQGE